MCSVIPVSTTQDLVLEFLPAMLTFVPTPSLILLVAKLEKCLATILYCSLIKLGIVIPFQSAHTTQDFSFSFFPFMGHKTG